MTTSPPPGVVRQPAAGMPWLDQRTYRRFGDGALSRTPELTDERKRAIVR